MGKQAAKRQKELEKVRDLKGKRGKGTFWRQRVETRRVGQDPWGKQSLGEKKSGSSSGLGTEGGLKGSPLLSFDWSM